MHEVSILKSKLMDMLMSRGDVLAAWEGGSAATGFLDDYSDLDLCVVIKDSDVEPVFHALEEHFSDEYGILRKFRIPEPAWHGMSQCFYLLADFPECFYCDIAVVPNANPHKFTEPDRHGNAVIWFDKEGVYTAVPTPEGEVTELVKRVLKNVFALDFLTIIELRKALKRGNWIASQMNWQMFLSRCLVPLLNVRWRPCKSDFGIRYADRDYPRDVMSRLEELLRYGSVEDIATRSTEAIAWYQSLKVELEAKYMS